MANKYQIEKQDKSQMKKEKKHRGLKEQELDYRVCGEWVW